MCSSINHLSCHNPIDREFMEDLGRLVDEYNEYLQHTQTEDQLDIHKELAAIMEKLKNFLP